MHRGIERLANCGQGRVASGEWDVSDAACLLLLGVWQYHVQVLWHNLGSSSLGLAVKGRANVGLAHVGETRREAWVLQHSWERLVCKRQRPVELRWWSRDG